MQSGREDNLEARYAIKFCVKLRKNATETFERLLMDKPVIPVAQKVQWRQGGGEGRWEVQKREGRQNAGPGGEISQFPGWGSSCIYRNNEFTVWSIIWRIICEVLREFRKRFRRKRP